MTCTCRKDITDKLTENFRANVPEASGHDVELQGYGMAIVGNELQYRPFMPYKTQATYPLKNGGEKLKSTTGNMFFSFCPFCGERIGEKP